MTNDVLNGIDKDSLSAIIESAPFGVFVTDAKGKVTYCNSAFCDILHGDVSDFLGRTQATVVEEYQPLFADKGVAVLGDDDNTRHLLCTTQQLKKGKAHYVHDASSMQQLVQEREELRAVIREIKAVDELTGMPNRRGLYNVLEPQVSRSRRYGNDLSVLIASVANFDVLAEKLNAEQQAEVVVACSQMLHDQVRWADTIGRLNENEFLLILPETTEADTDKLKEILHERFATIQTEAMKNLDLKLNMDFGLAQWRKGWDVGLMMQHARSLMTVAAA